MDGKGILDAIIALIIFIIFAIIYFIILTIIIKFSVGLFYDYAVDAGSVAMGASILTAGTLIAGGGMMDIFKKP
jgi:ABC-type multidrug transport system permease subunit